MTGLTLAALLQASVLAATPTDANRDYLAAYQRSVQSGRPLVVLVGANWCPACMTMKKRILPQVAQAGGLSRVEFTYIDVDRQRELAGSLTRGKSIPQLIRFERTPNGWSRQYLVGAKSPREVFAFINGPARAAGRPPAKPDSRTAKTGLNRWSELVRLPGRKAKPAANSRPPRQSTGRAVIWNQIESPRSAQAPRPRLPWGSNASRQVR